MTLQQIRNRFEQLKGQRIQIEKTIQLLEANLEDLQMSLHRHELAREIIREVGLKTQQQLQFHVSDIVSMALNAVFPDPYELKVNFIQRRNKTECDLLFVRNGIEIDPIDASGVGAIDIASFALRIALWSMSSPRTRNVIILDEPFRFLSENYQEQASVMIKEISQKLGIQFIIVTHEEVLTSAADRIFEVSIKDGKSQVHTVENNPY
jgi:DNA repair exonuclease SbcCD ATPase subunit